MDYVLEYINERYTLTIGGAVSFNVLDKQTMTHVSCLKMHNEVKKVFNLTTNAFNKINSKWVDNQIARLNSELPDFQKDNGLSLGLSPELFT